MLSFATPPMELMSIMKMKKLNAKKVTTLTWLLSRTLADRINHTAENCRAGEAAPAPSARLSKLCVNMMLSSTTKRQNAMKPCVFSFKARRIYYLLTQTVKPGRVR